MKLFQKLLVAPAALGLLVPFSANASEVNLDAISKYSEENLEIDGILFKQNTPNDPLLSGGEGLVESDDFSGGFSETTTASFGVDMVVGAEDGAASEAAQFSYQMGIGLETSFTGEDALSATIDIGDAAPDALALDDTDNVLTLDGLTYTFPVGGASLMVGDNTDISAMYTGACAYNAFTDYMGNCGTGSTVGVGGNGATAALSYAFEGGFSLAGGVSSTPESILSEEGDDLYGIEAAYTTDSFGLSLAYSDAEGTDGYGINAMYDFDFASLSAGFESVDDAEGFFVGLSFPEVGAGSFDIGMGTTGNFADGDTEYYTYEASYAYPVNDSVTITPGIYIVEGETDVTGYAVKTSFSF